MFRLLNDKKLTFKAISALLLMLLLLIVLLLSRDVITYLYRGKIKIQAEKTKQDVRYPTFKDYEIIVKNNLISDKKAEPYEIKTTQNMPEQRVDYKLIGTIAGDRDFGYAILSDPKGMQEVVRIGKKIEGLGILQSVQKTKVIIKSDDGTLKDIVLSDILTIQELQTISPKISAEFAKQTGEKTFTVDQKRIQHAIENPNQIMTDARLLPNFVDGMQKGFVLREVKPGGIYHSLGLRDGDVLLRINEYNISNPESGLQAFMALRGLERINLDIIRGGTNTTLTYLIR
ncbi:MAG: type II secretion system protein N [Thermodesulfovibrionales bacterium]